MHPSHFYLKRHGVGHGEEDLQRERRLVRPVAPQPVRASGHAESAEEVADGSCGGGEVKRTG